MLVSEAYVLSVFARLALGLLYGNVAPRQPRLQRGFHLRRGRTRRPALLLMLLLKRQQVVLLSAYFSEAGLKMLVLLKHGSMQRSNGFQDCTYRIGFCPSARKHLGSSNYRASLLQSSR